MGMVGGVLVLGVCVLGIVQLVLSQQENTVIAEEVERGNPSLNPQNFNPTVTASCRPAAGLMSVHVNTVSPFYGRVLTRTSSSTSSPGCQVDGSGALETTLTLNMVASVNDTDYCGVQHSKTKNTYSVAISVRLHKTLELAEDKQYIVTCNKAQTSSPIRSPIRLKVSSVESGRELANTYYGRSYNLGVEVIDGRGFRVRECVAFGDKGTGTIVLFDENGCPESRIVSRWRYDNPTTATTTIYSMFRFENSKRLTVQCVVYLCEETDCSELREASPDSCPTIPAPLIGSPSARFQFQRDTNDTTQGSGTVLTSLTMNVLDVGEGSSGEDTKDLLVYEPDQCYGSICPRWLLWLVITLGILFLLMLLVNCFLCSALTCSCTRSELIEREPSVIVEDYDPYRQSWTGSQFGGSRYSLNPPHSQLSGANGHKYH